MYKEFRIPPGFSWPGSSRLAILLTFDYQGEVGLPRRYRGVRRDLKTVSEHIYEPRVGIWRILDTLQDFQLTGTFPTCGRSVELYPDTCEAILEHGHELAAHGYEHDKPSDLTLVQERQSIEQTLDAFDRTLKHRPIGWRSPYYMATAATTELLADLGFKWQSDFHDDDLPYLLTGDTGTITQIPPQVDDWPRYWSDVESTSPSIRGNPRDILSVLIDSFETLYRESKAKPKMLGITLHPQIVGRPDRIVILREFIEHAIGHSDIWWARCTDVHDHITKHFEQEMFQSSPKLRPDLSSEPS